MEQFSPDKSATLLFIFLVFHDIAEILLRLALNTNHAINQSLVYIVITCLMLIDVETALILLRSISGFISVNGS
jgi:hypothetical protein